MEVSTVNGQGHFETDILMDPDGLQLGVRAKDGTLVPTATHGKYLGSLISWVVTFSQALKHGAAAAEAAYKQLWLVWNSSMPRKGKLHISSRVFLGGILIYGLDALTLTRKHMHRINGLYVLQMCAYNTSY